MRLLPGKVHILTTRSSPLPSSRSDTDGRFLPLLLHEIIRVVHRPEVSSREVR
jgi:hypothetical protein